MTVRRMVGVLLCGLVGAVSPVAAGWVPVVNVNSADMRSERVPERLGMLVHRRYDYHCHKRRGYRRWCHQGARKRRGVRDWRRSGRYKARRYRGRPYYEREEYRRRSWPRAYERRRYNRDRPDWRRWPYDRGPSVYNAI